MPKTKEQKRAEAIERSKISFAVKHKHNPRSRFSGEDGEQSYLDLFRTTDEISHRRYNEVYDERGYNRNQFIDHESHIDIP